MFDSTNESGTGGVAAPSGPNQSFIGNQPNSSGFGPAAQDAVHDHLTVFKAGWKQEGPSCAAKRFGPGGVKTCDYAANTTGEFYLVPIGSPHDLQSALQRLERDKECLVVHGQPKVPDEIGQRRAYTHEEGKSPAGLQADYARRIFNFDIDGEEAPDGVDPISVDAAKHVVRLIFGDSDLYSVVYQFSNSAGLAGRKIKVHLWFLTTKALNFAQISQWAQQVNQHLGRKLIDPSPLRPDMPQYTARPVFDAPEDDPFHGGSRVGIIEGRLPTVEPPLDLVFPANDVTSKPASDRGCGIKYGENGKVIDGRREYLLRKVFPRVARQRPSSLEEAANIAWRLLQNEADLTREGWDRRRVEREAGGCRLIERALNEPQQLENVEQMRRDAIKLRNIQMDVASIRNILSLRYLCISESEINQFADWMYKKLPVIPRNEYQMRDHVVQYFSGDIIYFAPGEIWYRWTGKKWELIDNAWIENKISTVIEALPDQVEACFGPNEELSEDEKNRKKAALGDALKWQNSLSKIGTLRRYLGPEVRSGEEVWASDPHLLNCQNGTLCLRTGALREHRRDDHLTMIAATDYDPQADISFFEKTVLEIMDDDQEMADYLQRLLGYCLLGKNPEHHFIIFQGSGGNGKSVITEAVLQALGDYGLATRPEAFLSSRGENADVGTMVGRRLVVAEEPDKNGWLDQSLIKQISGNERMSARLKYGNPFEFRVEFTAILNTNPKPKFDGGDGGMACRLEYVPFERKFEGSAKDPGLKDKLRENLPGILRWLVEGHLKWQTDGFKRPRKVLSVINEYIMDNDKIGIFLDDATAQGEKCLLMDLYNRYIMWCQSEGYHHCESKMAFSRTLKERGYKVERGAKGYSYVFGLEIVKS